MLVLDFSWAIFKDPPIASNSSSGNTYKVGERKCVKDGESPGECLWGGGGGGGKKGGGGG